jgi:hypothetical protein
MSAEAAFQVKLDHVAQRASMWLDELPKRGSVALARSTQQLPRISIVWKHERFPFPYN